jgi:arylsulfatase A-like enzyme
VDRVARADLEFANPGGATYTREQLATMHAGYYALISQIDHQVGRILATLDELGLADDTLVLFSTDHGEFLGEHQMMFKGPLSYDSLLRIPLLVRGPGFEAGSVDDRPVGTIDLGATMFDVCGIEAPAHVQGRSLRPGAGAHRGWTLTEDMDGMGELYDLADDPGELVSRWSDPGYDGVRTDLLALLDEIVEPVARKLPKIGVVA